MVGFMNRKRTVLTFSFSILLMMASRGHVAKDTMMHFSLTNNAILDFDRETSANTVEDTFMSPSLVSCAIKCANNKRCLAFFNSYSPIQTMADAVTIKVEDTTVGNTNRMLSVQTKTDGAENEFNCVLFRERIKSNNAHDLTGVSSGVLGISKEVEFVSADHAPPKFTDAILSYVTRIRTGLVAVYKCTGDDDKMTTFGWKYDDINWQWPRFLPQFENCYSTICENLRGVSASVLNMASVYKDRAMLRVECEADEFEVSPEAFCSMDGEWSLEGGNVTVACVSTKCYRVAKDSGAAHYGGSVGTTAKGETCMQWFYYTSTTHDWIQEYDDFDIFKVQNFCRDQDQETGFPWCYVENAKKTKEVCNVPMCVLDPLTDTQDSQK